ncbi:hypothetical protein [Acinetobacter baumannii]|uniref:hypothetical protein n=1 Tax=Acinetobacter baumannii TaxID=470 RepID=UPI0024DE7B4A|nr:hypothetical protein [Acinetobacter baumannii]MDK2143710.1 hypothetical protein [Acinetobacter baumannii]MDK2162229.1 hypothetical protein [Acinetobacter baumannii]MDK2173362.1 hypothetical protein [Acinetobacter baumannii]MDK2202294.1 hypothetical protein [Acinetobacter baumannii]MDK2209435.1 hypothetical protein [Acinetobacter baumannii]
MNYPKMLYKGDKVNFEYALAETGEHEEQLKEQGWIEHSELGEPEPVSEIKHAEVVTGESFVPVEQFDSLAEKLTETEEQLATAKAEYIRQVNEKQTEIDELKSVIEKGSAENIELHRHLRTKELEGQSADELKAILNERGVTFGARDSKPELVQLVLKSEQE